MNINVHNQYESNDQLLAIYGNDQMQHLLWLVGFKNVEKIPTIIDRHPGISVHRLLKSTLAKYMNYERRGPSSN